MGVHRNRKLTDEQATAIRREYEAAQGRVTYLEIARRMGVSEGTISRIIRGATYTEPLGKPTHRMPTLGEQEDMARRLMQLQEEVNTYGVQPVAGMPTVTIRDQAEESPFEKGLRLMREGLDTQAPVTDTEDTSPQSGGDQPGNSPQ